MAESGVAGSLYMVLLFAMNIVAQTYAARDRTGPLCSALLRRPCCDSRLALDLRSILIRGSMFIYIIATTKLTAANYDQDSVYELRAWRRHIAHDISNYDSISRKSLAQRICQQVVGVHMSTQQNDMFTKLNAYLGSGSEGELMGVMLCLLGLMAYYMATGKEMNSTLNMLIGALAVPRGKATIVSMDVVDGDGGYKHPAAEPRALLRAGCDAASSLRHRRPARLFWHTIHHVHHRDRGPPSELSRAGVCDQYGRAHL
jgi:hypothetical protein